MFFKEFADAEKSEVIIIDATRSTGKVSQRIENVAQLFEKGYKIKRDKDSYHYLINVASGNAIERKRGFSHRLIRDFIEIWGIKNTEDLKNKIAEVIDQTKSCYDGEKMPEEIRTLKGMIREFEEELVWGFFGIKESNIHHLRLGFYTGNLFTEKPNPERDV